MNPRNRTPGGLDTGLPAGMPQTPSDYLDLLRFRWPWIAALLVLGAIGSQVTAYFVPKRYISKTIVLVESEKIPRNFIPQLTTDQVTDRLRTINEEILARPRVERIIEELDPYPELIDVPRSDVVDLVRRRAAIGLRGRDAFVVEYTDTSPERAAQMAARLASLFIEETSGDRQRQVQGANEFIDSQLEQTRQQLEDVEAKLSEKKRANMGMLPNQLDANLATLQRLQLEQQSVIDQIRSAKDRKGLLERQLSLQMQMDEPEAQLIPDLPADGAPAEAAPPANSLPALRAYLAALRTRYTEEHPEVAATKARIARLEREQAEAAPEPETPPEEPAVAEATPPAGEAEAEGEGEPPKAASADFLASDLRAQIAAVNRDIELLEARQQEIQAGIARYQGRVERIPEVEQELQSLERDYSLISKYYSELLSRKLEAETAGDVERKWKEDQFKILDPAQVPDKPSFPNRLLFLVIGTLVGLGAGIGLAFGLEVLDPAVKNTRELENLLPYPVLLTLPQVKTPRRGRRHRSAEPTPPTPPAGDGDSPHKLTIAS